MLRVFSQVSLRMQRVGYLKRLIKRVNNTPTSNLENVGKDLIDTALRKFQYQLDENVAEYIKSRLTGNSYTSIKKQTNEWLAKKVNDKILLLELQDLYLADIKLPSRVGRLVKEDWRKYPQFGISLGFIRSGTYSSTTRGLLFLHLTSENELQAFAEYLPNFNPFLISLKQNLLLLYSFLDNDGEIIVPLWLKLRNNMTSNFSERNAGDLLPQIIKNITARYKNKMLQVDLRKRLESLDKTADTISRQVNIQDYSSVSAREETIRIRLEPIVDMGLLGKLNPFRFEYSFTESGKVWVEALEGYEESIALSEFLDRSFFVTAAKANKISTTNISKEEILQFLYSAWKILSSSNGYAPIEDLSLLACMNSLVDNGKILEIGTARETIIAYQKDNPYKVRFTVDRMGNLAHAKFIEDFSSRLPQR